jgi:enediyne biosynthesis protein E4
MARRNKAMLGRIARMAVAPACIVLGVVVSSFGCNHPASLPSTAGPAPVPPWFTDVTQQVGLDFIHNAGPTGSYFFPQVIGSGVALFDFDNDGRLDLYLLQNGGAESKATNRLYHQEPDGHFKDVTAGSGLDISGFCMGVAIGDVNNDGWPDVLITEYRGARLFLNNGNGTFREVTKEAGLDNPLWGTSAAFFDYDRDGWLDLVIVNYVEYDPSVSCSNAAGRKDYCHPSTFKGSVTKLFHNLGATGDGKPPAVRFEDVTVRSGLAALPGPGLGVICADFDGDGWPDILVANDSHANHLWINQHDGTFKEEAVGRGVAVNRMSKAEGNMGVAYGDVDGDLLMDLFITHLTDETNTLWRQGPRGFFKDQTGAVGLTSGRWRGTGFGTVLADFDLDGALDLAIANGRVTQANNSRKSDYWSNYAEQNQLFVNNGKGIFRDRSPYNPAFCGTPAVSRGLACGDLNNDGSMDLVVTSIAGPARVLQNSAPKTGHWLIVRAINPKLRRDMYGAEITVRAGDRRWIRLVQPAQSYLSSNDPRAHFGLGPNSRIDAIEVLWPDGTKEIFPGQAADQIITVRQGEGDPP